VGILAFVFALGCGDGCDDGGNNGTGTDAGDTSETGSDTDNEPDASIECEPNEIIECSPENSPGLQRCNATGDGIVQGSCDGTAVCRDAECVDVTCIPGNRRCDSDTQPQLCNQDGDTFVDQEACTDGAICEDGFCLNRCEIAERRNSYIGCEYWAVELENHLLNDTEDGEALPEDQLPPYALVLANTSSTYDAQVSVMIGEDEYAQAVPERTVASDVALPGTEYVTVHSELVDQQGNRLAGPIDGEIRDVPLPKGSLLTLILPSRSIPFGKSSLERLAYKIESTQPVVAYQFNPLCCNYNFTNDASLLLPKSALTENYMQMSYAVWNGGQRRIDQPYSPTITVMATEPSTTVDVQLREPKGTDDEGNPRPFSEVIYPFDADESRVSGPDANGVVSVELEPFEVLNIAGSGVSPTEDLTGALIEASKPIAVFGSHTCAYVPFNAPACDHLESQLFPLETWGQRFVASPLKIRREDPEGSREGTYWKFVARDGDTRIDTGINIARPNVLPPADEGVTPCEQYSDAPETGVFTLDRGETCEFGTRRSFVVESDKPIMLGAFLSGQNTVTEQADFGVHAGDPAFFLVPPQEQYRNEYSFLTPSTYFVSYVTVTINPGVNVTLDGETLDLTQYDYEEYPDRGIARAHIPLEEGPHRIEASIPFGIVVYGYDDYVSYAYTGGLNFKKLNDWER
jgi:hypothetical protein